MRIVTIFLFLIFQSNLSANFILKDELEIHQEFHNQVEIIGKELFEKSGISTYILILKTTNGVSLSEIGKNELAKLPKKSVLFTFTEFERKVDIVASQEMLALFDKEQILSPLPWSGTVLPILGEKIKQDPRHKYSVALFNGYADITEQIANSLNIKLESSVGNANKYVLNTIRAIFYGIIIFALGYIIYRKFFKRDNQSE
jgi:hypothetical protein